MIFDRKLRVAVMICAMALLWVAGCGPKPSVLYVEPPEPRAPSPMVETFTDQHQRHGEIDGKPIDASAASPAVDPKPEVAVKAAPLIHKVRWGHETLYTIALWYTGKGNNWRRLAAANPKIKPRLIRIGDTIRIPEALLKTHRPMPVEFLKPVAPHRRKPAVRKPAKAPALYGPVEGDSPPSAEGRDELPMPLETID